MAEELYSPKAVLVTGGLGFIASNFLNYMVPKYPGVKFVNFDRNDYCSSLKNVTVADAPNYHFVKGDLVSDDLIRYVLETHGIDTIIHYAAQTHVCNSFTSSLQFTKDNVLATHVLIECARQYGRIRRMIMVSTDEVYGEISTGTCTEQSLLLPTNPYAASKANSELIARSYNISYNFPVIITRGNNVYGPRQFQEKLIPRFTMSLLRGEKCTIHGKGLTRRNFAHVDDVARAFETILFKGKIGAIYNIGVDSEYTVLEIAELLRKIITPDKSLDEIIEYVPDRLFNDSRYSVDSSSLHALGWKDELTLEKELPKVVQWYREHGETQWLRD